MFWLIKNIFYLISIVRASNHTRCVSISNQKSFNQPTVINLDPNGLHQGFHYYPFAVNLGRCVESLNTLNDTYIYIYIDFVCLSNNVFHLYKTKRHS